MVVARWIEVENACLGPYREPTARTWNIALFVWRCMRIRIRIRSRRDKEYVRRRRGMHVLAAKSRADVRGKLVDFMERDEVALLQPTGA